MDTERREHPRVPLVAQAELSSSGLSHLLWVGNASRGGLFLQGTPDNYPDFKAGVEFDLHLFAPDDEPDETVDVHTRATIVRVEPTGFAVEFTALDDDQQERLNQLLNR